MKPFDENFERAVRRKKLLDNIIQAGILTLSAAAIWLVGMPQPWQGIGYAVGLASQPFWFLETLRRRQWGMFGLAIFYTGAWVQGVINHF